jgi:hypothetical protein
MIRRISYLIIITLLAGVSLVNASIEADYRCEDFLCVEGTDLNFELWFYNNANINVTVNSFFVIDKNTQDILVAYNAQKFDVPPGEEVQLNLTTSVMAPRTGFTHYYVPCINASGENESEIVCSRTIKTITITPKTEVECVENSDCMEGYTCNRTHYCQELMCDDDEAILPHSCLELYCGPFSSAKEHACRQSVILSYWPHALIAAIILIAYLFWKNRQQKSLILDSRGRTARVIRRRKR